MERQEPRPVFYDRWGKSHRPDARSVVRPREGVFACCVHNGHLLLIWPDYASEVPDLPGGGIDAGEDLTSALQREFLEETGMDFRFSEEDAKAAHRQFVHVYAEDVGDAGEFWHYHQTFFRFEVGTDLFFNDSRPTPENGTMRWVPLDDVKDLQTHYMHSKALVEFGLISSINPSWKKSTTRELDIK